MNPLASDLGFALPQSADTRYGPAQPRRECYPQRHLNPPCSPGMERSRSATLTPDATRAGLLPYVNPGTVVMVRCDLSSGLRKIIGLRVR